MFIHINSKAKVKYSSRIYKCNKRLILIYFMSSAKRYHSFQNRIHRSLEAHMSSLIPVHLDWFLWQRFHWGVDCCSQLAPVVLNLFDCPFISRFPGLGLQIWFAFPFFLPKTTNKFHPYPHMSLPLLQPESEPRAFDLLRRDLHTHSSVQRVQVGHLLCAVPHVGTGERTMGYADTAGPKSLLPKSHLQSAGTFH